MNIFRFLLPLTCAFLVVAGPEKKAEKKAKKIAAAITWQCKQARILNMSLGEWQGLHGKRILQTNDVVKSNKFKNSIGVYANPFKIKKVQFASTELIDELKVDTKHACEQLGDDIHVDIVAEAISALKFESTTSSK